MKILHLVIGIPERRAGGLNNYAYSIAREESNFGHSVSILFPGRIDIIKTKSRIKLLKKVDGIAVYELINPSWVAVPLGVGRPELITVGCNSDIYEKYISELKPDIIHIHTFMGFHKELFDAIKESGAKVVYTTHDYYVICPKCTMMLEDNALCPGMSGENCARCNRNVSSSKVMQYVLQSAWYPKIRNSRVMLRLKALRSQGGQADPYKDYTAESCPQEAGIISHECIAKYDLLKKNLEYYLSCVDVVHCNSSVTQKIYESHLTGQRSFVLNITSNGIEDNRDRAGGLPYRRSGRINLGYIGIRNIHKGFRLLLEAGKLLVDMGYDISITFWGDEFRISPEYGPRFIEGGSFKHSDIGRVMEQVDLMVVPGVWFETFGFGVLEAIGNSVPVIVSSRVGGKDLLKPVKLPYEFEPKKEELVKLLSFYLDEPSRLDELREEQKHLKPVFKVGEHVSELLKEIERA